MGCKFVPIAKWAYRQMGSVKVLIADTVCKRAQGLKKVSKLPYDTVMLFTPIKPLQYFHTKQCQMVLEIMPLSEDNTILDIWTGLPGLSKIGPTPAGTIKVLEAAEGWTKLNGLEIGDRLVFIDA